MKRLFVLLACLLAVPAQGQILSIIMGGTNQPAATPTFSPVAGAVTNPTTVTASTSTSDGCTIYFDTSNPPVTAQTTYSVTTGVTLYAQARGCAHHRDSLVGSAAYTISAGCTSPTTTSDWLPTATAGSSGNPGFNDAVGSNNATNASNYPSYSATGGVNSTPKLTWNGTSQYLNLGTSIPTNWTKYTGYVVFQHENSSQQYIMGASSNPSFSLQLNSNNMFVYEGSQLVQNSAAFVAGNWYAEAWDWTPATGVGHFQRCSSGSCVDDTNYSTGSPASATYGFNNIGSLAGAFYWLASPTAEIGIYNGTLNLSTLGTYIQCRYGL